ncbi:hypothetical protein ACFVXE_31630 [Streptomyces sp. NPDC058231]|uniref:hypothetical protein n=1 Tax=Streptomyces sp. NPDC058231 TaxID=3346392 RepID=UPI0036EA4850
MGRPDECAEGAGPFTTRLTWRLADGGSAVWESRTARRRGAFKVRAAGETEHRPQLSDATTLRRLRRLNVIASVGFTIGGALFALGAVFTRPATGSLVNVSVANWGTFAGALCFAAAGLLQVFERPYVS